MKRILVNRGPREISPSKVSILENDFVKDRVSEICVAEIVWARELFQILFRVDFHTGRLSRHRLVVKQNESQLRGL
jgi:hypothetical protein